MNAPEPIKKLTAATRSTFEHVPSSITGPQSRIWVIWKREPKKDDGKFSKVPYYVSGGKRFGKQGSAEDLAKLSTFAEAVAAAPENGGGIGIALIASEGLVILDCDNVVNAEGKVADWAREVCEGTYCEWSPSGKGLRAIFWGEAGDKKNHKRGFEVFHASGFVTITGRKVEWSADEIAELDDERKARIAELSGSGGDGQQKAAAERRSFDREEVRDALGHLDPNNRDTWFKVGVALGREFEQSDDGFEIYCEWSARSEKSKDRGNEQQMRAIYYDDSSKSPDKTITIATIFHLAREAGWTGGGFLIKDGEIHKSVEHVAGLLAKEDNIFVRGSAVVKVLPTRTIDIEGEGKVEIALPTIASMSPESVQVTATSLGRFLAFQKQKLIRANFPLAHARALLAYPEAWAPIRILHGLASAPFLAPDGRIVQAPGYDERTAIWLAIDEGWPTVPERPTRKQAKAALARLREPFEQFPFETEEGESVLVCGILTVIQRPVLRTAPVFYMLAPEAGMGKTLLVDAIGAIGFGTDVPKRFLPQDDEEARKVITTALLAGDQALCFDNVPREQTVRCAALDAAVTSGEWADRRLGSNTQVRMPFAMNVFITGNNIFVQKDSIRRGLFISLKQEEENPERRSFRIPNLLEHVRAHRKALVTDALTILRAYRVAGERVDCPPMGSFETWSRTVREAGIWCGMRDPLFTQDAMKLGDAGTSEAGDMLRELKRTFCDRWFTAGEVYRRAEVDSALRPLVEVKGNLTANGVSRRLNGQNGRVVDGLRLERQERNHTLEFRVEGELPI